jgi:hypothetical protein
MLRLEALPAERQGITDLTGIEYALNLNLTTLEHLYLSGNHSITDISLLSSLTGLKRLYLDFNRISDIRPLAGLTALTHLGLAYNSISDVNPLAGLYNLEFLHIQNNSIVDHSPLDGLALSVFEYDQICDMPPEPLTPRLENRSLPSIFASFGPSIVNKTEELNGKYDDYWDRRAAEGAYHDMFFTGIDNFAQQFVEIDNEWHVYGPMPVALYRRDSYHAFNPNMVFLAVVNYQGTANIDAFPDDHPYWLRDANGEIALRSEINNARLINYAHPAVQDIIVGQALAVARCGLYDGIFFDWWDDFRSSVGDHIPNDVAQRARINIVRRIRESTHPDFIIMGNVNNRIMPLTGPFVNGAFMESTVPPPGTPRDASIRQVRESLEWLETNIRQPTIVALQGGSDISESPDSAYNQQLMRATTTMSLTHSDGYVQFGIGHHDHKYWHDFWDVNLGQPVGAKFQFYEDIKGLYIREFTNGWAVYNQSGEAQVITLPEEVQSVASHLVNTGHPVQHIDGDIFLKVEPANPADVNGDGVVNIFDLTLVAQAMGTDKPEADVNGDGVVNVFDLVFVANQF